MNSYITAAELRGGTYFATRDRMDDDEGFRITFYVRREDGPVRYPNNVRIARFGFIQGNPKEHGHELKIVRIREDGPCVDPGEMDGRTPVFTFEPRETPLFLPFTNHPAIQLAIQHYEGFMI